MARPSVNMPDELEKEVEKELSYGDSKSEWFREATKIRLLVDSVIGDQFEDKDFEEKLDFIERALEQQIRSEEAEDNPNPKNATNAD